MISIKSHGFQKFTRKDVEIIEGEFGMNVTASGIAFVGIILAG